MARYPLIAAATPRDTLHQQLVKILESCRLAIIHDTGDYIVARELPHGIPFPQLVTVEGLLDKTGATSNEIRMEVVVKNEELPLQVDNHCSRMRDELRQALESSGDWTIVASTED